MARVVFVEAWYRGSHRAWADEIAARSRHDVVLVTHAGVHWQWRLQGAAPTLAPLVEAAATRLGGIDVLATTSSVPVAPLVALVRRTLGDARVVHYLHENQFTYPVPDGVRRDRTYGMIDWLSLAAADVVLCNSEHHRRDVRTALPRFLEAFPDHPHTALVEPVLSRLRVVPPGVDLSRFTSATKPTPPHVAWTHRWEFDKRPDRFVAAMTDVLRARPATCIDIVGSGVDAERVAGDLEPIAVAIGRLGAPAAADYEAVLRRASIVVSTADHEFYGLSIAEAMATGAVPVVPAGLAYPELVPAEVHAACLYDGHDELVDRIVDLLDDAEQRRRIGAVVAASARSIDDAVADYDAAIDRAVSFTP